MRIDKKVILKRYEDLNSILRDKIGQGMSIHNELGNKDHEACALWERYFAAKEALNILRSEQLDDYMDEEYAEKLLKNYKDSSEELINYAPNEDEEEIVEDE